jgi:hypothetical protein
VAPKKQAYLPPKPVANNRQEKEADEGRKGLLLKETEQVPTKKMDNSVSKPSLNGKPKVRAESI